MSTPDCQELKAKIASLQEALLSQHPMMPRLLQEIHKTLREYPENVTLLTDEEVGVIVRGLKQQTNTEIATAAIKNKSKSVKSITLADL